jgi:large subunit ribosomal protein L10
LFHLALKESGEHSAIADEIRDDLRGPIAVTFTGEQFPEVAKALVAFAKKNDKVKIKAGVMDGEFLKDSDVAAIATLPSREDLLAIIGRGLNTPATKIATGINEIMASLARGIKAVGEKNGG